METGRCTERLEFNTGQASVSFAWVSEKGDISQYMGGCMASDRFQLSPSPVSLQFIHINWRHFAYIHARRGSWTPEYWCYK